MKKAVAEVKRYILKALDLNIMHYLALYITLGFVALGCFEFESGVIRLKESFIDLWSSMKYYFIELFEIEYEVYPTVNEYSSVPARPVFNLPESWEVFKAMWTDYWKLWASKENLINYWLSFGGTVELICKIILLVVLPVGVILYFAFQRYLKTVNNDYNKDSKALTAARKIADVTYKPLIAWIKSFVRFLIKYNMYLKVWLLIWCYNFNLLVILIEFFAYYFYLVVSFDFKNMYRQFYKLFCDISVPVGFLPVWTWVILGLCIFLHIRKKIAYQVLYHHEAMNCGFINERSLNVLACGTMGKKKTTLVADMLLLQEKMFRDKALELMLENDMKFPNFPWINFENYIKDSMRAHRMYNLATIRKTVRHLRWCFESYYTSDAKMQRCIRRHLKRRYKLEYENLIFDYDFERYGLIYDDKLKLVSIWTVMENYAQEYFIYVTKSSLIIANFSVRTDSIISDLGNLPMRDNDFYHRNSKFIYDMSRYAHIVDYDSMRLNTRVVKGNLKKDSLEFGAIGESENGKERKNNLQLQEIKKKDEGANQKNDGYTDFNKMMRHAATIDYHSFIRKFGDEQRPESLGADVRDTYDVIHIKDGGKTQLALPFFFIEELFYALFYDGFIRLYTKYRYVRGDNTLVMHILKKFASKLQCYYKNTYNLFGYSKMRIQVESGTLDGELADKSYYLDNKRIYSDRFSTDCFSGFFETKALRSKIGIDDLEEYKTSKATLEELKMQNSYFVAELVNKQENDK